MSKHLPQCQFLRLSPGDQFLRQIWKFSFLFYKPSAAQTTVLLNCYRNLWQTEQIHGSLGQAKAGIRIITSPKYLLSTHTATDSSYFHSEQPKSLAVKMCAVIINSFSCMQFLSCKEKPLELYNSYCCWTASRFSWVLHPAFSHTCIPTGTKANRSSVQLWEWSRSSPAGIWPVRLLHP